MLPPFVAIAVRPRPGVWEYVRVNVHELSVEQLTVSEYLRFKEELVDGQYVLLYSASLFSALALLLRPCSLSKLALRQLSSRALLGSSQVDTPIE